MMTIVKHWINPWAAQSVYIPVKRLFALCLGYGEVLRVYGDKIDAYIIKPWQPEVIPHMISCGIRYGNNPDQYLSPYISDRKALLTLLAEFDHDNSDGGIPIEDLKAHQREMEAEIRGLKGRLRTIAHLVTLPKCNASKVERYST